ncbi:MAG: class I SAM-dependent methyltransferase [bacterium]|nr:class I SAM-dependent methyltransferase [bacterium]
MRLTPACRRFTLDPAEVAANRARFAERMELYRARGLDVIGHREWMVRWAGPLLGGEILELGCGRGYTALAAARAGRRLTAADRDPEMLRTTALNLAAEDLLSRVTLLRADAGRTPFGARSFDALLAVDFFHHAEAPEEVLLEIDRILKPGGRAIISDFDAAGLELIARVHAAEGRSHQALGTGREGVRRSLLDRGYGLEEAGCMFHWSMIARKTARGGGA